jgi:Holliday junction resolvasome RuvABC DNA-binding subunit
MSDGPPGNDEIADALERVAELLDRRDENPFRVRSYRRAASRVRGLERPAARIYREEGAGGLQEIEGVGEALAGAIGELIETGRLGLLDRLEAEASPVDTLARVPGIGAELAERIHDELGVGSLEELEQAAHDGRLAEVEGIGEKRLQGVRDALAGMLSPAAARRARRRQAEGGEAVEEPPAGLLLAIDREYRQKAEAGELRRIAPKRFNPEGEAWLPIMEVEREDWEFTALFSNTARAHELDKTHDWVVIYYSQDGAEEQCTVVTAGSGPLEGRRVVRGREAECRRHYEDEDSS